MKKEAVSVMEPHNGKTFKSIVKKKEKNNSTMIKTPATVDEPRVAQKAKIISVEHIDIGDALSELKNNRCEVVDQPKTEYFVNTNGNYSKKIANGTGEKMAVVRKDHVETRARPKKKLKTQPDVTIAEAKKQKKIVPSESGVKMPEVKVKPPTEAPTIRKSSTTRKSIENTGDLKITKYRVRETIQTVQQLWQKQKKLKKSLLSLDDEPLFLQLECIKVPKTPRRHVRPYLPHQMVGPLDDVALFVADLVRGRGRDYENTIDHWETILRDKGIDCIKEIIPMNKVKTEYSQYEMKRKLAMSFDYFLADSKICRHLSRILGNSFYTRRSAPTPVKLECDDLKKEFNIGLHKTCMEIHPYGNTYMMRIGTISMDTKKLAENVWAACEDLKTEYPGGFENIRSIRMKTPTGPAIPIYMNLCKKNNVPVPVVKPKRPRAYKTVEGELTTVPGGAKVKLTPEGRIYVKRLKDYGDPEEQDEDDDDDDDDDDNESEKMKEESEGERISD